MLSNANISIKKPIQQREKRQIGERLVTVEIENVEEAARDFTVLPAKRLLIKKSIFNIVKRKTTTFEDSPRPRKEEP